VGALEWRKIDLRFIAATHRTLRAEVAAGRFREDLFYRLNVFIIHLPPLRDRKEDIPLLVEHFLNGDGFSPSPEILSALQSYDWPGNVRELKHCLDRIAALQSEGVVQTADMPSALQCHLAASSLRQLSSAIGSGYGAGPAAELPQISLAPKSPVISLPESERQAISSALAATNGDRTRAARLLSIGRTTLYRKMKEYGFD